MTLSYDTAKKLKDAGFPFRYFDCDGKPEQSVAFNKETYYIPNLSELIEAVEATKHHAFDLNWREHSGNWRAFMNGVPNAEAFAATPEESVANLWLVLHAN